ncbi:sphingosine 1-phosphate receptor 3-like [Oculina patagonica]
MASLSGLNLTNVSTKFTNITMDGETKNVPLEVNVIITIIINCITCPFTVLLNVLVIIAVKRRPRLQSYTNILLARLAVTDALTGLTVQPSFILWQTFQLLGWKHIDIIAGTTTFYHFALLLAVSVSSALHLMLVTCERLIAIKYTMRYPYVVTTRNIKVAVIGFWVVGLSCAVFKRKRATKTIGDVIVALVLISCILFIVVSYTILYRETSRHQKMIKNQQLPQEEVERFRKESKALKTTVLVVGAVVLCFLPMAILMFTFVAGLKFAYPAQWIRTCAMLNSLLNPLIYCWRKKEMRQFVFRISSPAVAPVN